MRGGGKIPEVTGRNQPAERTKALHRVVVLWLRKHGVRTSPAEGRAKLAVRIRAAWPEVAHLGDRGIIRAAVRDWQARFAPRTTVPEGWVPGHPLPKAELATTRAKRTKDPDWARIWRQHAKALAALPISEDDDTVVNELVNKVTRGRLSRRIKTVHYRSGTLGRRQRGPESGVVTAHGAAHTAGESADPAGELPCPHPEPLAPIQARDVTPV